jgi:ABC-type multidrug transport system ATPase subunit
VLYNVKGACKPGQVMALMGPSGSGKTSLLSIIGGRPVKLMSTSGKVLFSGHPLSHQVKRNIGYVLQDDLLFEALTVEETLLYTARLRMSKDIPLCVPQLSFVVRSICYASSQLHVCLMYLCTMHTSKVRQVPSQRQA